jgi:hypothetical protein
MNSSIEVLGAMITPAVLISAAALLLLSTASRLGRVNDRLQLLRIEIERLVSNGEPIAPPQQKHVLSLEELTSLKQRLLHLRSAVTTLYITIALLILTSIAAGVCVLFPQLPKMLPIAVGMLGAIAFLSSIVHLVQEASVATHVTLREIGYVRELLDEQKTHSDIT